MALKIVKHTAEEFVVRQTPYSVWFFGGLFLIPGLLIAVLLAGVSSFECERTTGICVLEKSRVFLPDGQTTYPLQQLEGARVAVSRGDDGDTYRVEFLVGGSYVPLTISSSSGSGSKHEAARKIEEFLSNPEQQSVRVEESSVFFGLLFGMIFAGVGLLTCLGGKFGRYRFSIPENRVTISTAGLLRRKKRDFSLSDVEDARLGVSRSSEGGTYRGYINLKSGESIPMKAFYSNFGNDDVVVDALQAFLRWRPEVIQAEAKQEVEDLFPDGEPRAAAVPQELADWGIGGDEFTPSNHW